MPRVHRYVVGTVGTNFSEIKQYVVFKNKQEAEEHAARINDRNENPVVIHKCKSESEVKDTLVLGIPCAPPEETTPKKRQKITHPPTATTVPPPSTTVSETKDHEQEAKHVMDEITSKYRIDCTQNNMFLTILIHESGWILALKFRHQFRVHSYLDDDLRTNTKNKYELPCIRPKDRDHLTHNIQRLLHAFLFVQWFISNELQNCTSTSRRSQQSQFVRIEFMLRVFNNNNSGDRDWINLMDTRFALRQMMKLTKKDPPEKISLLKSVTLLNLRRALLEPAANDIRMEVTKMDIRDKLTNQLWSTLTAMLAAQQDRFFQVHQGRTSCSNDGATPEWMQAPLLKYPEYVSRNPSDHWIVATSSHNVVQLKKNTKAETSVTVGSFRCKSGTSHHISHLLSNPIIPFACQVTIEDADHRYRNFENQCKTSANHNVYEAILSESDFSARAELVKNLMVYGASRCFAQCNFA